MVLYDRHVYAVGKEHGRRVEITKPKEIKGLNGLQVASAQDNLYYRWSESAQAQVDDLPMHWRSATRNPEVKTQATHDGGQLVMHYDPPMSVKLDLDCIRIRPRYRDKARRERAFTMRADAVKIGQLVDPDFFPTKSVSIRGKWRRIEDT
jgi:hypothetical protein